MSRHMLSCICFSLTYRFDLNIPRRPIRGRSNTLKQQTRKPTAVAHRIARALAKTERATVANASSNPVVAARHLCDMTTRRPAGRKQGRRSAGLVPACAIRGCVAAAVGNRCQVTNRGPFPCRLGQRRTAADRRAAPSWTGLSGERLPRRCPALRWAARSRAPSRPATAQPRCWAKNASVRCCARS